jgi:lipoate-protein ligase A
LPDDAQREIWWFEVSAPALVLGSSQRDDLVDFAETGRRGVDVVRRRSGGGAVYLEPGAMIWLDVLVPRSDPLWDDDIVVAARWLGAVWRDALVACQVPGLIKVHQSGLEASPWSSLVCFAGLGPGEVTVDGVKAVGISQRRTRAQARFQCCLYRHWQPDLLLGLLQAPKPTASELRDVAVAVPVGRDPLRAALTDAFAAR